MNNIEIMKTILQMYKFNEPVPPKIRAQVLISRKKNLIVILKKFGKYGLFSMLAVRFFFFFKKTGITITFVKSYVIATIISVATASLIIAGSGFAIKKIIDYTRSTAPESSPIQTVPEETPTTEEQQPQSVAQTQTATKAISYKVEINPLFGSGELAPVAATMTKELLKSMRSSKKDSAFISGSVDQDSPYLLTGSVVKLGSLYVFNVRLVEASSSKMIAVYSQKSETLDQTKTIANSMATDILKKIYKK